MTGVQMIILILVSASALGVVCTKEMISQIIAMSFYGILLGILFFAFQAPDVAFSQIVVGAVVLPLMLLLALARICRNEEYEENHRQGGQS